MDKIKALKLTEFEFKSFVRNVSNPDPEKDNKRVSYLTFELVTPIPKVISSLTVFDPSTGKRISDIAVDVTLVNCNLDLIQTYESEFKFKETADGKLTLEGSYSGDMFLDLSRRTEVWLTDTKFSRMSGEFRKNAISDKFSIIKKKYDDLK